MSKQDKLSTLYTAAMAPRKYECADRDETLRMIGEQDEAARRAKVDEAVADILTAHEVQLTWLKRMDALSWDDPTYAPKFKRAIKQSEDALAALRESLEGCK